MNSSDQGPEQRAAYRTLSEPMLLLGITLGGWAAILAAGALGYGWLLISPLPWRVNASMVTIGFGVPIALLLLRETSAISPARMLAAAVRWRARPATISSQLPVPDGGVRLTTAPTSSHEVEPHDELPWLEAARPAGESSR